MTVRLQASNGLYVSAEQGGNMVASDVGAMHANRQDAWAWENFELEQWSDGAVSFKTSNGYYVCADQGEVDAGKVRTNSLAASEWERFFLIKYSNGETKYAIQCSDKFHYLTADMGRPDVPIVCDRTEVGEWEQFIIDGLNRPLPENIKVIKANLCGYLPLNLPQPKADPPFPPTNLFFTPSYVVYPLDIRAQIRAAYLSCGYTHMPLNLTNHSTIYRNCYPDWDDSYINQYLTELLDDGIVPIGYTMGDSDQAVNCKASPDLVPIAIGRWEDATPIKGPHKDEYNLFYQVQKAYPKSLVYWHNPPYQGAPFVEYSDWGLPQNDPGINAKVWNYMVHECGVVGLLFQGKAWENDSKDSIGVLQSFTERLGHGVNGWPIADLCDYEETAYYLFNEGGDGISALDMTKKIRSTSGVELTGGWGNG